MSHITLYTNRRSPPGRAVEITAKIIGVDLKIKLLDLIKLEHMTEEFSKLNPQLTIPTIVDNGVPLYDSHAIMIYLVSKYAQDDDLYPKDLMIQARINTLLHFESGVLYARLRSTVKPILYFGSSVVPHEKLNEIHRAYDLLEATLQSDYLVGNTLTLADISCSTSLTVLHSVFPIDANRCPKLVAYLQRLEDNMPYYKEFKADCSEAAFLIKQKL
ncbi:glutathione S-transferase 1-like [Ochlerotatus camptorhynchus]|uniref:glutathione S-transferase 1-like n=1 Tax=Ochlerotatus camptorhynchus TaxID=644619 RepID=UPI0031D8E426